MDYYSACLGWGKTTRQKKGLQPKGLNKQQTKKPKNTLKYTQQTQHSEKEMAISGTMCIAFFGSKYHNYYVCCFLVILQLQILV